MESNSLEDEIDLEEEISSESDLDDNLTNISNNKKGTHIHTIKSKLKIINYAKKFSQKEASIKFTIPTSTINDWMEKENQFLNVSSENLNKKTLHKGTELKYPQLELALINFIEFNSKLFNPISTWSLILKMLEIIPQRRSLPINTNQKYIYRFLARNNYSFRTKSHIGQCITNDCFLQTSLFLNEVWDNRIKFNFSDTIIANMDDETPLFFNMTPSKTVAKKGGKSIIIRTQNQEKCRLSVLLTITADGTKLPPFLIFKAKVNGDIEKELSKDINVVNGKCFICCNNNAWCTEEVMTK